MTGLVRRAMRRIRSCATSTRGYVMGDRDFRGLAQRLIDNAIPLRQANERTQLALGATRVEVQVQPDTLKSDRRVLGHAQRATKIEIALRPDGPPADDHADAGSDRAQRAA